MQCKQENQVSNLHLKKRWKCQDHYQRDLNKRKFPFFLFLIKSSIVKLFCIHIYSGGDILDVSLRMTGLCMFYFLHIICSILVNIFRFWTNVWILVGMNKLDKKKKLVNKVTDSLELTSPVLLIFTLFFFLGEICASLFFTFI